MNKFKVGDWVKVKYCINGHRFPLGQKVQIAEVTSHDYQCENKHGDKWFLQKGEIEPLYRGTAEIKLTRSGQYRFTLKGKNGEPVATSHGETYTRKAKCLQTLKRLFPEFEVIDLTKGKKKHV